MTVQDNVEVSARARFRARLGELVEQYPELSAGQIADLVGRSLPDEDRDLVSEFLSFEARNILAWELRAQFSRTRQGIFGAIDLSNPESPSVESLPETKRERLYERITQWREFNPLLGRTELLLEMTRPSLLASSEYDAAAIFHRGWKMQLKKRLADQLPDDSTPVSQCFTPDQVLSLGETLKKEFSRGNFRLKITPVHPLSGTASIPRPGHGRNIQRPEAD